MDFAEFVNKAKNFYKTLLCWILVGILSGTIIGIILISVGTYSNRVIMLIKYPGDIFIRMLNCIAVPLMASCLVSAVGGLDKSISLRVGIQFLICSFVLKLESAMLGYIGTFPFHSLRNTMNKTMITDKGKRRGMAVDNYLDLIRNMFCKNLLEMFIYTFETVLIMDERNNSTDVGMWKVSGRMQTGPNVMGIVVVSLCAGLAVKTAGSQAEPLVKIIKSVTKLFFILMRWIIFISPVFLVFLMAGALVSHGSTIHMAKDAGLYLCAFTILYPIQFFVVYPLFYFIATRKNPLRLYSAKVILTAFSTSSSLATMPLAIEYFEEVHQFDSRLVKFVLSVGVNISKDGATLFYTFSSRLASFVNNVDLTPYETMRLFVLAMAGSVAAPGVPFGAMAILWVIWTSLGFIDSADFYGTVFSLEWLRDRISTVTNLYGNCFILAVIQHYNKDVFKQGQIQAPTEPQDEEQENAEPEDVP